MASFLFKSLHHFVKLSLNPRTVTLTLHHLIPMASWSCKKCTFLNSPSHKSCCQICLSSPPSSPSQHQTTQPSSSSSSSDLRWTCKACTFLNVYNKTNCEICDTRAPTFSLSCFEDLSDTGLDSNLDSSIGSVFFPLRRCNKRKVMDSSDSLNDDDPAETSGNRGTKAAKTELASNEDNNPGAVSNSLKILSYNVWFREDLELRKRMDAIGDLILLHSPDIICFQEVTPNIYELFRNSTWWNAYRCSISKGMSDSRPYFCMQLSKLPVKSFSCKAFGNSIMGRELCIAEVEVQGNKPLIVATSHLESPCPGPPKWDQMFSKERVDQAKEAVSNLRKNPNVIFAGDMNWDDKLDGKFPLPDGWVDAWTELRPNEIGYTYDTKSNQMLSGNRTLQKRLDRFICGLRDFTISGVEMIGKKEISGLSYYKEKKVRNEMKKLELPVLPSDHYGLVLTISRR